MEELVNGWVAEGHPCTTAEMPISEAKAAGALAMFDEKYGDTVRVCRPFSPFFPARPPPPLSPHTLFASQSRSGPVSGHSWPLLATSSLLGPLNAECCKDWWCMYVVDLHAARFVIFRAFCRC